jgi:hypothetical protein
MGTSAPSVSVATQQSPDVHLRNEANSSGVSWAAVFAGAFVAAAMSLIFLTLGTGLGLSSVSPWSGVGASASAIGSAAIIWLILMQFMSSSLGGYLAGRLRTKWASIHTDEVYFRDTAHGFLVWAVGLVITASFLASAAVSMMGGSHPAAPRAPMASSAQGEERTIDPNEYFVDALFRSTTNANVSARTDAEIRREAWTHLFERSSTGQTLGSGQELSCNSHSKQDRAQRIRS